MKRIRFRRCCDQTNTITRTKIPAQANPSLLRHLPLPHGPSHANQSSPDSSYICTRAGACELLPTFFFSSSVSCSFRGYPYRNPLIRPLFEDQIQFFSGCFLFLSTFLVSASFLYDLDRFNSVNIYSTIYLIFGHVSQIRYFCA